MKYIYVLSLLCFITAANAAVVERPATRARFGASGALGGIGGTSTGGISGTGVGAGVGTVGGASSFSGTGLNLLKQNVAANSTFVANSSVEKFTNNTTTGKNKEDSAGKNKEDSVTEDAVENSETCVLSQIKNTDGKCVDAQVLSLDDLRYGVNAKSKENAKVATDYCWGKFYKDDYSLCVLGYKVSDVFANGVAGDNKTTSETTDSETGTTSKSEDSSAGAGTESADASSKSEDSSAGAGTESADTSSKSEDSSAGAGTESADTSSKSSNSGSDTNSSAQDKAIETFSSMMGNTVAKGFSASGVMGGTGSSNSTSGSNTTSSSTSSNTTAPTVSSTTAKTVGGSVGSVTNTTSGSNTTAPTVSSTTTKTGGGSVGSVTNSTVGKVQSIFGGSAGGLFKW